MPERFPAWKREPMKSRGVRFMGVKNFNVFYAVNKKLRRVSVFRVLYNRRNI
jgi:toxin ParE1/3/4